MTSQKKRLFLVDGTAFAYRAHYARLTLTNSRGEPTDAVFGFEKMINRIIRKQAPDYLAVIFDAKGKTFRDDIYPEYKANRKPMPDDLRIQYPVIQQLVELMGIKSISITGVEADDVLATLAVAAEGYGWDAVIVSTDKDLAQVVNDSIIMRDEHNELDLGPEQILEKFGVSPRQIVDFLALVGDSADNIPGVRLVGKITAAKWLAKYGSLDAILQNSHEIKGKAGENLRNAVEQIELSTKLVTLRRDVDVGLELEDLAISDPNKKELYKLYSRLGFRTLLRALDADDESRRVKEPRYHTVNDKSSFARLIERLNQAEQFALDTETTGFDMKRDALVGISISIEAKEGFYIPLAHNYLNVPEQLDQEQVLSQLKPILENPDIGKIVQNLKFDANVFAKYGIEIKGKIFDTMLESYVLDSTSVPTHSLDNLALKYLQHSTKKFEDVAGKGKNQLTFDYVDVDAATKYAAEDTDITLQLHELMWPRIAATGSLQQVFEEIEMPLVPVLDRMEHHGVLLDRDNLRTQSSELQKRMQDIETEIYRESGSMFNLASPKQIQAVLYQQMGLPSTQKTSTGAPSTSESALRDLAKTYDVPRLILEHRHLAKLKSTYTDKLTELIDPDTKRVHTSFHQTVAATGRLSSSNPNLQNIPIRTPEGQQIRTAFIAEPNHVLISIDYSQIELRLMAHVSEDDRLVDAFFSGEDVHRFTASEVFDTSLEKVTSNQRRHAKAINFGLMYGMSAYGLSRQLDIEVGQAKHYMDQYFARYPGVKIFMDQTKKWAKEKRYVETIRGRRLYFSNINSKNYAMRQRAERAAINAPLQGSAADIIKLAMIEVDRWLSESKFKARMILQVHDELVFEVPANEEQELIGHVKSLMENVIKLKVPLVANAGVGTNWASAH